MTPLDQNNIDKLKKSLKYQLKHKLVSLLTQQQMKEKAQQALVEQNKATITDEKESVLPTIKSQM